MDSDYDQKFEEMMKYIPFLETMIKRLEKSSLASSNPRQAQLDKIRSLRDLLSDKKKRMKMENLLKCEQVLINLYAKVEQRDGLSDTSHEMSCGPQRDKEKSSLEAVRNKFKSITKQGVDVETKPDIARSSETLETCSQGSNEPALFQRRPNKISQSQHASSIDNSDKALSPTSSKRNYTRVLVSPEISSQKWKQNEPTHTTQLFYRRSPTKRSPRKFSPSYHKKERKKSSKNNKSAQENNDFNITLSVPEDSLNSLNPKDILSRIIQCSDGDVDIATLRKLRTQILSELKQTGTSDDISDLILKSYKTKKSRSKCKKEVEEGELSDSESEAIENIYGSLVVVDKNKSKIPTQTKLEEERSRKIQICLVINTKESKINEHVLKGNHDISTSDLELFDEIDSKVTTADKISSVKLHEKEESNKSELCSEIKIETNAKQFVLENEEISSKQNGFKVKNDEGAIQKTTFNKDTNTQENEEVENVENKNNNGHIIDRVDNDKVLVTEIGENRKDLVEPVLFKPNFYKPLVNDNSVDDEVHQKDDKFINEKLKEKQPVPQSKTNEISSKLITTTKPKEVLDIDLREPRDIDVGIPLLNEPSITSLAISKDVVSQIDILQALKNEILNENVPISGLEPNTPPLHQPKVVKVVDAQKNISNRISIQKYKEKSSFSPLFVNEMRLSYSKEDSIKKQSIKLTEKECERFNFDSNLDLVDVDISSEDEVEGNNKFDEIYDDLAPKSPDLDDSSDAIKDAPIIIPAEPIKTTEVSSKADVDMRTFLPLPPKNINLTNIHNLTSNEKVRDDYFNETKVGKKESCPEKSKEQPLDPRIKKDLIQPVNVEQPASYSANADMNLCSTTYSNNKTDTLNNTVRIANQSETPNLMPIIPPLIGPLITPNSRTYESTPTHQSFSIEDTNFHNKHVYAPSFFEPFKSTDKPVSREINNEWDSKLNVGRQKTRWEKIREEKSRFNDPISNDKVFIGNKFDRFKIDRRESNPIIECPQTPAPSFGWSDLPNPPNVFNRIDSTPSHPFGRSGSLTPSHPYGRSDCNATPTHAFGRTDCLVSPNPSYGRSDCPPTPNHPFGLSECPPTPSYQFGRSECHQTPTHPFGRLEGSSTPNYSYGRLDGGMTPNHTFGHLEGSMTPNCSFGRYEGNATPSHAFGRTDYPPSHLFSKDPRVNKPSEFDQSHHQSEDRNIQYYQDRGYSNRSSYSSHKRSYHSTQYYRNFERERSVGRNERDSHYSIEYKDRHYRQEPGRDLDHRYRERDYRHETRSSYREKELKYIREGSTGRKLLSKDSFQSATPELSKTRNNYKKTNLNKTLSVKSHAGRSFTIDTSVNSTFQNFKQKEEAQTFDQAFNVRRKRASSVGRSLIIESSISKPLQYNSKTKESNRKFNDNHKYSRYTRARSLGRDLSSHKNNKSFQEIKTDFQNYKIKMDSKQPKYKVADDTKSTFKTQTDNISDNDPQSVKRANATHKCGGSSTIKTNDQYFPSKNCRDPRMRREINHVDKTPKQEEKEKTHLNKSSFGIVYSKDNLAKGTILGSGYGVKNYKIPKIKRSTTEDEEKELIIEEKLDNSENNDKKENDDNEQNKDTPQSSNEKELNEIDKNSSRRITRSTSKVGKSQSKSSDDEEIRKTRKLRKSVIYDSDSECETNSNENKINHEDSNLLLQSERDAQISTSNKNALNSLEANFGFGLDDLDSFTDNNVSDPVIENINALIADLDNDIGTSKNDVTDMFTENVTLESMLNSMDSSDILDANEKESTSDVLNVMHKKLIESFASKDESKEAKTAVDSVKSDDFVINNDDETDFPKVEVEGLSFKSLAGVKQNESVINCDTKLPGTYEPKNVLPDVLCCETINTDNKVVGSFKDIEKDIICEGKSNVETNEKHINTLEDVAEKSASILVDANQNKECDKHTEAKQFTEKDPENIKVISDSNFSKIDTEIIVSTTNADVDSSNVDKEGKVSVHVDECDIDGCSTPDSTINANDTNINAENEVVPDSTNEVKSVNTFNTQSDINADVTSTNTSSDLNNKEIKSSSSSKFSHEIDSIHSILSVLQDKSKIKELLKLLEEKSSDNEKIRKKLEKLSEIVSDDEDSNNDVHNNSKTSKEVPVIDVVVNEENVCCTEKNFVEYKNEEIMSSSLATNHDSQFNNDVIEESEANKKNKVLNNKTSPNSIVNQDKYFIENYNKDAIEENKKLSKDLEVKALIFTDQGSINSDKADNETKPNTDVQKDTKVMVQKVAPVTKKVIKRRGKRFTTNKSSRMTQNTASNMENLKVIGRKKPSRELLQLQEDIKEMFLNEEILNTTGIRMCRLAKMVDEKNVVQKEDKIRESRPVVVLKNILDKDKNDDMKTAKLPRKRPGPKPKVDQKAITEKEHERIVQTEEKQKIEPATKSKVPQKHLDPDPYAFESDSVDVMNESGNEDENSFSDSQSLMSSQSFGSNELLGELVKKPKRKRRNLSWQAGVIKPKNKKKKIQEDLPKNNESMVLAAATTPDMECFTDKLYCFHSDISIYPCRLCVFSGNNIVLHYKQQHPHVEIPISRMSTRITKEAISQCEKIDFSVIDKITINKYTCRFCNQDFSKGKKDLEKFFWHIVSMHTGEYKLTCSECVDPTSCPSTLDIPPPPNEKKGQLIGYVCKKCNYTQMSIENLKRHVIARHNDEKTEVYKIYLAVLTNNILKSIKKPESSETQRITRSSLTSRTINNDHDMTDEQSNISDDNDDTDRTDTPEDKPAEPLDKKTINRPQIKSKIVFETDNHSNLLNVNNQISDVKQENFNDVSEIDHLKFENQNTDEFKDVQKSPEKPDTPEISPSTTDILECTHFKMNYSNFGSKEYVCFINGQNCHYKTSLLISMKKHIQKKHTELWEGYCNICKVIVTSQGSHSFKDCLQHMIDKHPDEFPIMGSTTPTVSEESADVEKSLPKSYINVRPLAQLVTNLETAIPTDAPVSFQKIKDVVSFGSTMVKQLSSPVYPAIKKPVQPEKQYKYEEWQADVMARKHRVVLETMMTQDKLIKVFKCAGRFCSFTTDVVDDALSHASTHQRKGGANSLICAYCDFDTSGDAIDLVMHVFKVHGRCQYFCALCFYRAAASELVGAHVERVHGEKPKLGSVLHAKNVSVPVTENLSNLLSRQEAVEHYYCAHGLSENNHNDNCKYKTYIAEKFVDHLELHHQPPNPCTICSYKAASPIDLIEHMKSHNINMYQCTWCVHGADSEDELLAHASMHHPTKHPNAYIRVITNKEDFSELRVLPMASFNKIRTPAEDVISTITDNPYREAERSLDLEKLIGDIENVTGSEFIQSTVSNKVADNVVDDPPVVEPEPTLVQVSSSKKCDPSDSTDQSAQKTSNNETEIVIKSEPSGSKVPDSDIIICCSDSDDDEPSHPVIDLSNDDTTADCSLLSDGKSKPVQGPSLNKCPRCGMVCRFAPAFKKHVKDCWSKESLKQYRCPHTPCSIMLGPPVTNVILHNVQYHKEPQIQSFFCGICDEYFCSMQATKKHMIKMHEVHNYTIKSEKGLNGNVIYKVFKSSKNIRQSGENKRRYGPEDVDKLPISPILDDFVYCSLCEFNTKVRLNLVRHLQLHAEQQPVPHTAPVNPVPHLETHEKHFDKMLNLASSSIATRTLDKARFDAITSLSSIPPETASRFPKYVPERYRYTCGSKGCTYTSLSEELFRCHWDTLHSNTTEYFCVHCPPNQQLDRSQTLTAALIIAHLKMHDSCLYACKICQYYHYKHVFVENHLSEVHGGGQVIIVRECSAKTVVPVQNQTVASTPTMDLKPWQCGLCQFKSMLRPEVAEHCWKVHQSKMQYKCTYCPFRTSTLENVSKHQTNSHAGMEQDVFYFYYREGSIPDDNGTPRWVKQKQKLPTLEPEVKTEIPDLVTNTPIVESAPSATTNFSIDLNIVKQEVQEMDKEDCEELSLDELYKKYGKFCEPNGLKYKCSLCSDVVEDTKEAMKSHLYEELKYRRWSCNICSYKAYHINGLKEHVEAEHKRQQSLPIELPINVNIEKWVTNYLQHQETIIGLNKNKLMKQKLTVNKVTAGPSKQIVQEPTTSVGIFGDAELECTFGQFGSPTDTNYNCPKCDFTQKDEGLMRQHLEFELNKIRWGCSLCSYSYQTYHQAQFHCKSAHQGQFSRPIEAVRDPVMRDAWVDSVLRSQRLKINIPEPIEMVENDNLIDDSDNSLLVVRYVERVQTPEEAARRKHPELDSDDDNQKPDNRKGSNLSCDYCKFKTKYRKTLNNHIYRHYDLKPFQCSVCSFMGHNITVSKHIEDTHNVLDRAKIIRTPLPEEPPKFMILNTRKQKVHNDGDETVCLICEQTLSEKEAETHLHDNQRPEFARAGEVVVKCCVCMALRLDHKSLQEHHNAEHPNIPMNYVFFKMHSDSKYRQCGYCNKNFRYLQDLKTHHEAMHAPQTLKFSILYDSQHRLYEGKRKSEDDTLIPNKRVARKSTTKLPFRTVAKKSTTKLPMTIDVGNSAPEYSYYGNRPTQLKDHAGVTAFMPFCGTVMSFSMDKLSEIINISPKVVVEHIKK